MGVYETVSESITERYGVRFREGSVDKARRFFTGLCMRFGDEEVLEAWDIVIAKYDDPTTALSELGCILYNRGLFSSFIGKD